MIWRWLGVVVAPTTTNSVTQGLPFVESTGMVAGCVRVCPAGQRLPNHTDFGSMHVHEIRGFAADAYYVGGAGELAGAPSLSAFALVRVSGRATANEHLFGNADDVAQTGWRIVRRADNGGFLLEFAFEAWCGGVLYSAVLFQIPAAIAGGRMIPIHGVMGASQLSLYFFGFAVSGVSLPTPFDGCSGSPSIGFNVNNGTLPATGTGIIACGYVERELTPTEVNNNNAQVVGGRNDVTSAGLTTPWSVEYSFPQDAGFGTPSTLHNRRSADYAMSCVGRENLINGTPHVVYGF